MSGDAKALAQSLYRLLKGEPIRDMDAVGEVVNLRVAVAIAPAPYHRKA